jgi:hypothetical protein
MTSCQIMFLLACVLRVPIAMFPSKEQIYNYYRLERNNKTNFKLTCAMTFIAVLIPLVYPDIVGLLGLLGGLTVGTTGYTIPYLLKVKSLSFLPWYHYKKLPFLIMLFIIIFICIGSCYVSVVIKLKS